VGSKDSGGERAGVKGEIGKNESWGEKEKNLQPVQL